jgi:hypothetical protein
VRFTATTREPLSNVDLLLAAPSIFAERPFEKTSDRYAFIPTIEVVDSMRREGWFPVAAREARVRKEEKRGYTRHEVRFRNMDIAPVVGDTFPEVALINSHDAGSSYQLEAGLFRLACANGMVVPDGANMAGFRIHHKGDIAEEVLKATAQITHDVPQIIDLVEVMNGTELTWQHQRAFAEAALALRWGGEDKKAPISPDQLLQPRRNEDVGNSVWKTFNRIQENLTNGGMRGVAKNNKRMRVRGIESITEDVRLNKALWILGEKMVELVH